MSPYEYSVQVDESTAIRLFMEGKLFLGNSWPDGQAASFLQTLKECPFEKILEISDSFLYEEPLDSNLVPHFADVEVIDKAVHIICSIEEDKIKYSELAYYLVREEKKDGAYRKYGEYYGKGTSFLGLTQYEPGYIGRSCLTFAYDQLPTSEDKAKVRNRLFLRIPFIGYTLFKAKDARYNAYDAMQMFSIKERKRRGQSPRMIFKELQSCGCHELNRRINNIYWEA